MFQIGWAGKASDYDPAKVIINTWEEDPILGQAICQSVTGAMSALADQLVTLEANGNTHDHAGIFISITSQTRNERHSGPVKRPRTGHRQFKGATA